MLLTEDGDDFRSKAPRTLGIVNETENHILMTEGSRYLKNRWLQTHGNAAPRYDNAANGMEGKLPAVLAEMKATGLFEFNSQPYIGYTITALLNFEAFGAEPLRVAAREVLDTLNWSYALGSYRLRHFPPFPNGPKLSYDPHSRNDRWVMTADGDRLFEREFDHWPLFTGDPDG